MDVKFQNLMSSLGSWSKISKLLQVGDFYFFGSKSSLLQSVILNQFSTKKPQCPSGVQCQPLRTRARSARVVGVGNGAGGFRFTGGNPPKKNLKMFYYIYRWIYT